MNIQFSAVVPSTLIAVAGAAMFIGMAGTKQTTTTAPAITPECECPLPVLATINPGSPYWMQGYHIVEVREGRVAYDDQDPITVDKVGEWFTVAPCNCGVLLCSQLRPCLPSMRTSTVENQFCWEVTGGVSAEIKFGLIARLFGELGVSVNIGGKISGCKKWIESFQFPITPSNCFREFTREISTLTTLHGIVTHYPRECRWIKYGNRLPDGTWEPDIELGWTACTTTVSEGEVEVAGGQGTQNAPRPAECGGTWNEPEEFGYKRAEPCCQPLCVIPPGEVSCCHCTASQ